MKEFLKHNRQLKELSQAVAEIFNEYIGKDVVLNSLNAQIKEIDRQLNNLANAVANGIFSKTTNQKLNELEQEKEKLEIKIAQQKAKSISPLDADKVYKWFLSFQNIDSSDKLACKRMIDMFVNKIVLYDDYFDIYFNTSDDESKNIKLDNPEDFEEIEKEQPSGLDCSSLVHLEGLEPSIIDPKKLKPFVASSSFCIIFYHKISYQKSLNPFIYRHFNYLTLSNNTIQYKHDKIQHKTPHLRNFAFFLQKFVAVIRFMFNL